MAPSPVQLVPGVLSRIARRSARLAAAAAMTGALVVTAAADATVIGA